MPLLIRAISLAGAPLTPALAARFDERGGSIGRADDNTLALPDPERHISRRQAEVTHDGAGFSIRNVGSANAILLNDAPIEPGQGGALAEGDALQIGSYRLLVGRPSERAAPPLPSLPEAFRFDARGVLDEVPADVFAALRPAGSAQAGCMEQLMGGAGRGQEAFERFMHGPGDERTAPIRPPAAATLPDRTPAVHAPMPLPRPRAQPAPPACIDIEVDAETPPAPAPAPAADALWAAFCQGLGLALPAPPGGLGPEMATTIGQILHHLAGGSVQLLHLRSETKHQLHFPMTMLRTQGNNPLRYSPNVQAALTQLLQPPLPGYMAGPEAAREAMDDLCAHAIGTMAGMRAALEGVLARFEPRRLEGQVARGQVLDTLLPMHRRARLWDLFVQHFETVRAEAKDDFDRLYGQAFVGAYEAQLDRLDAQRRPARRTGR